VDSSAKPLMTNEGLDASIEVEAFDEFGNKRQGHLAAERALTLFLNKKEIVTLMTLGCQPELLVLGWLRNQRIVKNIHDISAIQVDWETQAAAITTHEAISGLDEKLERKTVTTGCGQGTVFGSLMDDLDKINLPQNTIQQSRIYGLLKTLNQHNEIYKRAGAVHGCALCHDTDIKVFIEDVGRHNAVDAIAGHMWLNDINGNDSIFYTTGRLTSEMVIKVAQMGIPLLLSRSGATQMGLELARKVGVTLIARAKGQHFLVYNGVENIVFDAVPQPRTSLNAAGDIQQQRA
jgi:FdhD protein